jgi:hypothetical protein
VVVKKSATWKCFECGAGGEVDNRKEASDAFSRHWVAEHQEVNF